MFKKPELIIVDDHLIFREGLVSIITVEQIGNVVGEASDGIELLGLLTTITPDVVIMDIDMPRMNGIRATQKVLKLYPNLKIIAYTMFSEEEYYYKMIELGVKGFILKSGGMNQLEEAIHEVMMGRTYFSQDFQKRIAEPSKNSEETAPKESLKTLTNRRK